MTFWDKKQTLTFVRVTFRESFRVTFRESFRVTSPESC